MTEVVRVHFRKGRSWELWRLKGSVGRVAFGRAGRLSLGRTGRFSLTATLPTREPCCGTEPSPQPRPERRDLCRGPLSARQAVRRSRVFHVEILMGLGQYGFGLR